MFNNYKVNFSQTAAKLTFFDSLPKTDGILKYFGSVSNFRFIQVINGRSVALVIDFESVIDAENSQNRTNINGL